MSRRLAVFMVAVTLIGVGRAYAQDIESGPGKVEVTIIPGGGTFFTGSNGTNSFWNYTLGGSVAYNVNQIIGFEGELGGSIGVTQNLMFGGLMNNTRSPNLLSYTGNVVAHVPTHHSVVPYAAGGLGGLTLFSKPALGILAKETHFTGNLGGGLKWYAPNGRWGLRGDYRFVLARAGATSSEFWGTNMTRHANRIYGAFILNAKQ